MQYIKIIIIPDRKILPPTINTPFSVHIFLHRQILTFSKESSLTKFTFPKKKKVYSRIFENRVISDIELKKNYVHIPNSSKTWVNKEQSKKKNQRQDFS